MNRFLYSTLFALALAVAVPAHAQPPAVVKGSTSDLVPLKKGMPYTKARALILAHGYQPWPDPKCFENVMRGENGEAEKYCKKTPHDIACSVCRSFPELSHLSGVVNGPEVSDGDVFFKKGSNTILMVTFKGDLVQIISEGNTPYVMDWGFVTERHGKSPISKYPVKN